MVTTTGGVKRWRLICMLLQTFIVLHPVLAIVSPGDFTSVHLAKYLNKSVSPCADFHRHVCSIGMSRHELPFEKSERYYEDLADSLNESSTKNQIEKDYESACRNESCIFNAEIYKSDLGKRCGYLLECYLEELYYFFHLYKNAEENEIDVTLQKYVSNANRTDIPKIMEVTSKIVGNLIERAAPTILMDMFTNLRKRLAIMSSNKDNQADVVEKIYGVDKVRKAETIIKRAIVSRFMETAWLNETNEFGLDLLSQYLTTLNDLRIVADFDKFDYNLWSNIDRLITEKYFEYGKRSTGHALLDVVHPIMTLVFGILKNEDPVMTLVDFHRLLNGFSYNAFNYHDLDSISIAAPTFYPFMWQNSSDITQLGFAGFILGHEIFHSFINITTNTNKVFQQEAACLMKHLNESCKKWAEGACNSGNQTLNEDGPDLEGLRVAYELLKSTYSDDQLQEVEYEDLGFTRKQAYFYAYAVRNCHGNDDHNLVVHTGKHSASNIRLNAALSLMPEFTEAFGCQKEDKQYSKESTSCYLFGPLAGTDRQARIGKTGKTGVEGGPGSI